jgi:mannose-6-phosphate isomerase
MTLGRLVAEYGPQLLGRHHPQARFPLLFKYLDANRDLSVQVHPDDARAALLDPPDLGKTEAWYIVDAKPGSLLYAGLKKGLERDMLAREIERGTVESCLHQIEPQPGQCVFIPAGVTHAIGGGLLVAEIQQASDTTYRLFDWNRVDAEGRGRQLHIESGLEAIDYECGPVSVQPPQPTSNPQVERIVASDKFVLDRWRLADQAAIGDDDQFHIVSTVSGSAELAWEGEVSPLNLGQTLLIPACVRTAELRPGGAAQLLDMYLP